MYITAALNQKGGVGKTGMVAGAAGALAARGRRVLVIDLDPQGHLTTEALQCDEVGMDGPNLADALTGKYSGSPAELIMEHSKSPTGGTVDVLPTSLAMYLVVRELYLLRNQERRLAMLLERLDSSAYDHVLLDCPPSLDVLTDNALVAADGVLIPVQPAKTSLRALRLLLNQVGVIEQELGLPRRDLLGLVPSVFRRPLSGLAKYVAGDLEAFADSGDGDPLPVLAHLPLGTVVEEAWLTGRTVADYAPASPQADAYRRLAIRLDVAAGVTDRSEWDELAPLPSLARQEKDHG